MEDCSSCYAEECVDDFISDYTSECDKSTVKKTKCSTNEYGNVSIQLELVHMSSYGLSYSFTVIITKRTVDKDRA